MKGTKLTLGILSLVLSAFVIFQSCAAGIGNALEENGEAGGSAGLILAIFLISSGIIAIVCRDKTSKGMYVAGGLNIIGGIIGLGLAGSYEDLTIWGVVSIIIGICYIVMNIAGKKKEKTVIEGGKESEEKTGTDM